MENRKQGRDPALDVIRIFALFCVIAAHFYLYNGYYNVYIVGSRLYLATLIRTFCICSVPLFLILSGYLMRRRQPTKSHYLKLSRIIGEYVLASLFCMLFRAVLEGKSAAEIMKLFLLQSFGILSYEAADYAWYVEMYIGLFLLIPYLNILYDSLRDKRKKQGLIFTMLLLSGIPEVINSIRFSLPWTMTYNDPSGFLHLVPNWWSTVYPITQYLLGVYLREYPLKLSRRKTGVLTLAFFVFAGTYNYWQNANQEFLYAPWQAQQSLFPVIQGVLVFHYVLQLDLQRLPLLVKKYWHAFRICLSAPSLCPLSLTSIFTRCSQAAEDGWCISPNTFSSWYPLCCAAVWQLPLCWFPAVNSCRKPSESLVLQSNSSTGTTHSKKKR